MVLSGRGRKNQARLFFIGSNKKANTSRQRGQVVSMLDVRLRDIRSLNDPMICKNDSKGDGKKQYFHSSIREKIRLKNSLRLLGQTIEIARREREEGKKKEIMIGETKR